MKKNRTFIFTVLVLLGIMMAGCGEQQETDMQGREIPPPPPSNANNTVNEIVKPKDPVTLIWFNAQSFLDFEEFGIIDALKAKLPHITLEIINRGTDNNYPDLIASGRLPDIIFESAAFTTSRVMEHGFHHDMQNLIKKHNFDLNTFEPNILAQAQATNSESKLYGLPFTVNKYATFYNIDLFNKFGVDTPRDGLTWDESYDLAKRMTRVDGGVTYQGFTAVPNNMMLNNQLSIGPLHPTENKATINHDNWKLLYENLGRFFQLPDAKILPTGDFANGMIAMMINAGAPGKDAEVNWDLVSVPTLKERPNVGFKPATLSLFVTETSKHKDDAFEVVAQMVSEEIQTLIARAGRATPLTNKNVQMATGQDLPHWQGKNVNALYYYQDAPPTEPRASHLTDVGVDFGSSFARMVNDGIDVNTVWRDFEEQINQAIEAAIAAKAAK